MWGVNTFKVLNVSFSGLYKHIGAPGVAACQRRKTILPVSSITYGNVNIITEFRNNVIKAGVTNVQHD